MRSWFNGEIALGFALGILALLFLLGVTSYQIEHCGEIDNKGGGSSQSRPKSPPAPDANGADKESPDEDSHPISCGIVGIVPATVRFMDHHEGFFVAVFTLALFFATRGLWHSTSKLWEAGEQQLEIARRTMVAGQRAWIHVSVSNTGDPIRFNEMGAQCVVKVSLSNVGASPAIYVTIHARLTVVKNDPTGIYGEQRRLCAEVASRDFHSGFALFPGERFPENFGDASAQIAVDVSREDLAITTMGDDGNPLDFYVIGCVDYTFPTDPATHHQTAFIHQIRGINRRLITIKGGDVPGGQWVVRESGVVQGRWLT